MVKKIYMKNAFITGGLGFIGSELAKYLIKNKIVNRCIILDNFGSFINPWFTESTVYIANDANLKSDLRTYSSMEVFANVLREHEQLDPFSEVYFITRKIKA